MRVFFSLQQSIISFGHFGKIYGTLNCFGAIHLLDFALKCIDKL